MKKTALRIAAIGVALVGGLSAYRLAFAGAERPDCPGRIICPITGEEICKDQCPLARRDRPDCAGKIECPLTGETICRDECPLDAAPKIASAAPDCCRGKE